VGPISLLSALVILNFPTSKKGKLSYTLVVNEFGQKEWIMRNTEKLVPKG
jgi:hypothetical protein